MLLDSALTCAPSAFDFQGVRHAEGSAYAARGLSAPQAGKLIQFLVVQQGQLLRCGWSNHVLRRRRAGMRSVSRCWPETLVLRSPVLA
ncbi:hypothetical protein [Variovorax sp. LARHSF232]